jgi:Uncharacterized conserved protein (DUF2285)/Family of unknown function (DUF6499)
VKPVVGGVLSMPQVRKSGTAWERRLEDYAYTVGLDRPGLAWEFLRRNASYIHDVQDNPSSIPKAALHSSGAQVFTLRQREMLAENWGLVTPVDPTKCAADATIFWLRSRMNSIIPCHANASTDNHAEAVNLSHFRGQKSVLVTNSCEYVVIQDSRSAARMVITGKSFLSGDSILSFNFEGIQTALLALTALRELRQLMCNSDCSSSVNWSSNLKYRDYLVALDGHLAQRSYRDIAEVLYGSDRVKEVWTNETRHLKDKVRRAVQAGIELMNGGYVKLLS